MDGGRDIPCTGLYFLCKDSLGTRSSKDKTSVPKKKLSPQTEVAANSDAPTVVPTDTTAVETDSETDEELEATAFPKQSASEEPFDSPRVNETCPLTSPSTPPQTPPTTRIVPNALFYFYYGKSKLMCLFYNLTPMLPPYFFHFEQCTRERERERE